MTGSVTLYMNKTGFELVSCIKKDIKALINSKKVKMDIYVLTVLATKNKIFFIKTVIKFSDIKLFSYINRIYKQSVILYL